MSTLPVAQSRVATGGDRHGRFIIHASVEQLLAVVALFWALAANKAFFSIAMKGHAPATPGTWVFLATVACAIVALHFLLLGMFVTRWTVKPVLSVSIVAAALATYFIDRYGIYLDPSMLRNVLRTDPAEARELLTWGLLFHFLPYAALPLALLWRVRVRSRPWKRAVVHRIAALAGASVALVGAVLLQFQPLASLMRNHKEARYLLTPANVAWSLGAALSGDAHGARMPREPIGVDARRGPRWAQATRPRIIVMVVGETARAANWGLAGYARQTTPELATLPVISFDGVTSCGTSTEVSLPCMFAPVGRRHYDEARIRRSESLLHVAQRAGVSVHWRDNQSGCKGVCEGLSSDTLESLGVPGLCEKGRCFDEGLLTGLDARLGRARGVQLLVLHQLGNHGPSYFRRYPPAFSRFQPACESDDLQRCSRQEIVNAYDNALLYTDHVLAMLIARLQAHADVVDSAMLYVSDHGESLGEGGLFLHGVPYAIAPREQTQVPMVMWMSKGFAAASGLDPGCLSARAKRPSTHDHLFHTLLGLLDVNTEVYEPALDLAQECRRSPA